VVIVRDADDDVHRCWLRIGEEACVVVGGCGCSRKDSAARSMMTASASSSSSSSILVAISSAACSKRSDLK
jgi:hypothetical protein